MTNGERSGRQSGSNLNYKPQPVILSEAEGSPYPLRLSKNNPTSTQKRTGTNTANSGGN